MPIYRQSSAQQVIYIRRPIDTVTTIEAYGSWDGYSQPHTEFGTDETIMIGGSIIATDGADLSLGEVDIRINGPVVATVGLSYDPTTGLNFFQYTLGILAEGDYTIEARFTYPRR